MTATQPMLKVMWNFAAAVLIIGGFALFIGVAITLWPEFSGQERMSGVAIDAMLYAAAMVAGGFVILFHRR